MSEDIKTWAEKSKSIAKEHYGMKLSAFRDYRKEGLFSIRNFKNYFKTAVKIDKAHYEAYLVEWQRLICADQGVSGERALDTKAQTEVIPKEFQEMAATYGDKFAKLIESKVTQGSDSDRIATDVMSVMRRLSQFMTPTVAKIWLYSYDHEAEMQPIEAIVLNQTSKAWRGMEIAEGESW